LQNLRFSNQIAEKHLSIANASKITDPRELDELRERLISEGMAEILDPEQLSLRRIHFLRERFNAPASIFNSSATLLLELGMPEEQFRSMQASVLSKNTDIRTRMNTMVTNSLVSVAASLSEAQASRLWQLFGRDLNSLPRSEFRWQEIQVLPNTSAKDQLRMSRIIILPDDLKLSSSQVLKINELENVELTKLAQDRSSEVSAELDRLLSKEQRSAIVQGMQRNLLLGELTVVLSPEVVKHIGIEGGRLEVIQSIVTEDAKMVRSYQLEKQMELLRSEISVMPMDFQVKLMKLLEGVWE
jgi:hypothetical protein